MDLNEFFGGKPRVVDLKATDSWKAVDELIEHLAATGKIKREHVDAISAAVKKRESSMSTGIGFGVGMPHAATEWVTEVVGVIGRSRDGIQFDALDGQLVTLVAFFLVPQGQFQKHLYTLANIAKLLHDPKIRDRWRGGFE